MATRICRLFRQFKSERTSARASSMLVRERGFSTTLYKFFAMSCSYSMESLFNSTSLLSSDYDFLIRCPFHANFRFSCLARASSSFIRSDRATSLHMLATTRVACAVSLVSLLIEDSSSIARWRYIPKLGSQLRSLHERDCILSSGSHHRVRLVCKYQFLCLNSLVMMNVVAGMESYEESR